MELNEFSKRLTALRIAKGVSAREMSLALGLSPGYINNVENGVNFPSMTVFFYICEYFGITPGAFFETDVPSPTAIRELTEAARGLRAEQIAHLTALAKELR